MGHDTSQKVSDNPGSKRPQAWLRKIWRNIVSVGTKFYKYYVKHERLYRLSKKFQFKCILTGTAIILIVVSVATTFFLSLAKVSPLPTWWPLKAPALEGPVQGYGVTAAAGILGGFFALVSFLVNYQQKNRFQREQTKTQMTIAAENREQQNTWEKARLDESRTQEKGRFDEARAQSEYDAIAARYHALSSDFVSDKEVARLNAAIGMSLIATKADPRLLLEWNRARKTVGKKEAFKPFPKTLEHYPWFEPVARQLTIALACYESTRSTNQVTSALFALAEFTNNLYDHTFSQRFVDIVAEFNRQAYNEVLASVEEWVEESSQGKSMIERRMARIIAGYVCVSESAGKIASGLVEASRHFRFVAHELRDRTAYIDRATTEAFLEARFSLQYSKLMTSRDLIRQTFAGVSYLRMKYVTYHAGEELFYLPDMQTPKRLSDLSFTSPNLRNCYMAGVNFDSYFFEDALFLECDFEGSSWRDVQFMGGSLRKSRLSDCLLINAEVVGTHINETVFDYSDIANAKFAVEPGSWYREYTPRFVKCDWKDMDFFLRYRRDTGGAEQFEKFRNSSLVRWLRKHYPEGGPRVGEMWPDGQLHEEDYEA